MSFLRNWFKRPVEETRSISSLRESLLRAGLQNHEQTLSAALANSIFIFTAPSREPCLPIGTSRIGGLPDLPEGFDWPEVDGKPLVFLAQFNLMDVRAYDRDGLLPATGFLYFFYGDGSHSVWGFDPGDKDHWRVIFHLEPKSGLKRRNAPPRLSPGALFKECTVRFSTQDTLPNDCPAGIEIEADDYTKLLEHLGTFTTHHQLLGHESPVQGDVKLECQLVSNGLYCGDASGHKDPRAEQLRDGVKDWILLLQVDSDDNANMMWGDLGRLYFCMRQQDLKEQRFEQAWMTFQCH